MADDIAISLTAPATPLGGVDPNARGAHMWTKSNAQKMQKALHEWMPVSQETHTLNKSTRVLYVSAGGALNVPTVVRTQAFKPRGSPARPQAQPHAMAIVEVTNDDDAGK